MPKATLGPSKIESKAAEASSWTALGGLDLLRTRNTLKDLLSQIGATPEFSTYTRHDIAHIDAMLESVDWIIPTDAWKALTAADALLITLSIYVHDLGMLVTKSEFERREEGLFPQFIDELFNDSSPRGIDFRDRLSVLNEADREHFLYEEFVRRHHAVRIERWVNGGSHGEFGASDEAARIVSEVLAPLDQVIRDDVAMLARSHHLDDLADLTRYKINRRYGPSAEEVANLQYAAVVLRTADLLHMTRDRTPMVQYRLASPTDPMGQKEWRKQSAIRAVTPKSGGSGTIEVHASFESAEGFFALMEYLDYCEVQLAASRSWVAATQAAHPEIQAYSFPWGEIDREQIEAKGFDRHQFVFQFDQQKVLELLTGHTLYNDASVAVREVVQNAIDAVRLQSEIGDSATGPLDITVHYDTATRLLTVTDRGVGMNQKTIVEHFLKVGSSSYQTDEFKDKHPGFDSISRFGIGVLSAFMIADEVRVATKVAGSPVGLELVLKSVHGRYLIKNLQSDAESSVAIGDHGTQIALKLRASSGLTHSIEDLLKRWVIVPRCPVYCIIDDGPRVRIGADDVAGALDALLSSRFPRLASTRVEAFAFDGINVAVAEQWNETYKEWEALRVGERDRQNVYGEMSDEADVVPIEGVSIQGVRVTDALPGFSESAPIMLVDAVGQSAPRTNVARTDLESGPELEACVRAVYRALLASIEGQIAEVSARASTRLALREASHLFRAAASSDGGPTYTRSQSMREVLDQCELHPVETAGTLRATSSHELTSTGFSVLIGPAADDAARFLDWLPKPKGLLDILKDGGLLSGVDVSTRPLLGGQHALFAYDDFLWRAFEVTEFVSLEGDSSMLLNLNRSDDRWSREGLLGEESISVYRRAAEYFERLRDRYRGPYTYRSMFGTDADRVRFVGEQEFDVVFVGGNKLFMPGSRIGMLHSEIMRRIKDGGHWSAPSELATLLHIVQWVMPYEMPEEVVRRRSDMFASWLAEPENSGWELSSQLGELTAVLGEVRSWSSSSASWRRGDSSRALL